MQLDDRTADPEAVACNYCRAVMVDVLAVAASWRMWFAPHCTSPAAPDTLTAEHGRCIEVLTSAMPAGPGLSDWYAAMRERGDDPFKDEEAGGGEGGPVRVAEGVVTASTEVAGLPGVQLKRVGAVPWVAEAAVAGNFEAQVRTAALRMLRCAMGAGEGLVVVAREFRAESGRDSGVGGDSAQRLGIGRAGSGYTGAGFDSRGSRALGSAVGVHDDDTGLDGDVGEGALPLAAGACDRSRVVSGACVLRCCCGTLPPVALSLIGACVVVWREVCMLSLSAHVVMR